MVARDDIMKLLSVYHLAVCVCTGPTVCVPASCECTGPTVCVYPANCVCTSLLSVYWAGRGGEYRHSTLSL